MHRHLIQLVLCRGDELLQTLDLTPGTIRLGRAEDNELCLEDLEISRYHARIVVTAEGARFEDSGSGNGSWIGERRVEARDISDGDVITISPFTLSFRVSEPERTVQLPVDAGGFGGVELDLSRERRQKGFFSKPLNRFSTLLIGLMLITGAGLSLSSSEAPSAPPPVPPEALLHAERLMQDGMDRFQEREYEAAINKFVAVLKIVPFHTNAQRMGYLAAEFITLEAMHASTVRGADADRDRAQVIRGALDDADVGLSGHMGQVHSGISAVRAALETYPGVTELEESLKALEARRGGLKVDLKSQELQGLEQKVKALYEAAQVEDAERNPTAALQAWYRVTAADPDRLTNYYFPAQDRIKDLEREAREGTREGYEAGLRAMNSGDYLTARQHLREVLRAAPSHASAQTRLRECQSQLMVMAATEFQKARVMEKANQLDRALGHYQQVLVLLDDRSSGTWQAASERISAILE